MTLTQLFTSIANAIRTKKGTSALIQAEDFADEISTIKVGGSEEVLTISINTRPTITNNAWTAVKIGLNSILSQTNSNALSLYNNGIKIGTGISRIKVSGRLGYWNYNATGEVDLCIYKNSTDTIHIYDSCKVASQIEGIDLNPVVIDVAENDVIYLYVVKGNNTGLTILDGYATNITVEVV